MSAVRQLLGRGPRPGTSGIIPAIALPEPEQGLSFGTLMTGMWTSGYSGARAQAEYDGGCRLAMFEVFWRDWESTSGVLSPSYTAARQAQLADLLARGFKVVLGMGLHYKPSWYDSELAAYSHHMVDHNGQVATDSNMTFSQGVRSRVEQFLTMVNAVIPLSQFHAIRMTSGDTLEYDYPQQGATYSWWGFDAAAQGGADLAAGQTPNPWPGWQNGQTKPGGATTVAPWCDWYVSSLTRSAVWMMTFLTSKGFNGWFDFTMPGSGVRPSTWAGVRGNANLLTNDVAAIGAVWQTAAQLLSTTAFRNRVRLQCTSSSKATTTGLPQLSDLAIPIASSTMNSFSESRWIIRVAKEYGFPSVAENPGYGLGIPNADYTDLTATGMMQRIFNTNTIPGIHPVEFYLAHSQNVQATAANTIPLSAYTDRIAALGPVVDPKAPGAVSVGKVATRPIFASILASGVTITAARTSGAALAVSAQLRATVDDALVFNAESVPVGDTLTAGNTGATSVTIGATSTATADATQTHSGGAAYKFSIPAGSETSFMTLPVAAAGVTKDIEVSAWVYVGQTPTTSAVRLMTLRNSGGTILYVRHLGTGRIELQNAAITTVATSTVGLPNNAWVKIIIRAHVGTTITNSNADVSFYNAAGASLGMVPFANNNLGTTNITAVTIGKSNPDATGNAINITADDIRITVPQPTMFSTAGLAATAAITADGTVTQAPRSYGAYADNEPYPVSPHYALETALSKPLPTMSWFTAWNSFLTTEAVAAKNGGYAIQYCWEASGIAFSDIVAGTYDTYLTTWMTAAKNSGADITIRLFHEMNGNWYDWAVAHTGTFVTSTAQWISAWQRIVGIRNTVGASNVKFMFCANSNDGGGTTMESYYPGDAYVDVLGIDGYAFATGTTFASVYQDMYNRFRAIAPSKTDIQIGEIGTDTTVLNAAQDLAWWTSFYDNTTMPLIGKVNFFHKDQFAMNHYPNTLALHQARLPGAVSSAKATTAGRTVTATITAAGTVTAVPTPPSANMVFRFRGDDAPGAAGAAVASWPAAPGSPTQPALTQATGIYQPVTVDNVANGHRGVSFDGTNDRLEATGTLLDAFRNRTGAIVAIALTYPTAAAALARTIVGFSRGTTNDANRAFVGNRGSSGFVAAGGRTLDTDGGAFLNSPSQMAAGPTPRFIIARFDYANTDLYLYVDGVLVSTNSTYQAATITSDTPSMAGYIGASVLGTTENFAGVLLEVLTYSTASATTVADLITYLTATYYPTGSGTQPATRAITATITAAGTVTDPSAMPVGDLPGWTQVFADDFNYDFAEGTITPNNSGYLVTGPAAATVGAKFSFYPDTWNTTHGTKVYPITVGEPGYLPDNPDGSPGAYHDPIVSKYYPSKVLSFSSTTPDGTAPGVMRIRQHTETVGGVSTAMGAVVKPRHPNGQYMNGPYARYAFRMRVRQAKIGGVDYALTNNFTTSPDLYHIHVPLSINSSNWGPTGIPNGEFNHPDGDVNRKIKGTYHPASNPNESWSYEPTPPMSPFQWHRYETIWEPGRVRFLIDGIAWKDTTDRVPSLEMAIAVFQHESNWRQPDPTGEAITEIDWIVMYDPA